MQPYDILMLIVLVGTAAFGAWKGMAWQLASIASVVLSSIVALRFSGVLAPSLSPEEPWNQFLAMGILFAGTSLAVWIAFRFVAKIIDRVKLKEFDRQMGALFGAAKGLLYCLILTFFAVTLNEGTRQRVLDSRSGYYAAVLVEKGTPLMPERVRSALGEYIRRLDEELEPAMPPEGVEDLGDTTVADGSIPFPPLGGSTDGAASSTFQPTDPNSWRQGAKDLVGQYTGQFGGQPTQPAQPQYPPSGYESLQQGAQNFVNEQANEFGQRVGDALQSQANQLGERMGQQLDQYGRQAGSAIDQNYTQFRNSVDDSASQFQNNVQRTVDELGRRIQQAPMRPIQ